MCTELTSSSILSAVTCSPPCQNGGSCVSLDVCVCSQGWTGTHCTQRASKCAADDEAHGTSLWYHSCPPLPPPVQLSAASRVRMEVTAPLLKGAPAPQGGRGRAAPHVRGRGQGVLSDPSIGHICTYVPDIGHICSCNHSGTCSPACQNGGTCLSYPATCACVDGWSGRFCENGEKWVSTPSLP